MAGANRQLQPRRADAGVRRRKGQQLERLHDVADAYQRAVSLRFDRSEGRSGRRDAGRGIPAHVLAGRQGDRLSREPADAQGLQPRLEAVAHGVARGSQLLLRRRRPVLLLVPRLEVAAGAVRSRRADVRSGGRDCRRRWHLAGAQPHSERLRRCHAEVGDGRQDDDLGHDPRWGAVTGRRFRLGRRLRDVLHEGGLRSREAVEGGIRAGQGARGQGEKGSRGQGQDRRHRRESVVTAGETAPARSRSTGMA